MSTNQNYGPPAVSPQIKEVEYSGPNAICVENPAGTFTNGFYREVYNFDRAAGSPASLETVDREYTVNGTTWSQTIPTGTIRAGACVPVTVPNEVDRIATTEEGCAAGTGWTRRTEQTVDNVTGAVLTTVVSYVNAAGTAQAAAPAGFALGACVPAPDPCCPEPIAEGCWRNGGNSGRWVSMRASDGTVTLTDPVTGLAVPMNNVVDCVTATTPVTITAQHNLLAPSDVWTPAQVAVGSTLTSVTFVVLTGTANVVDNNATEANGLPAGLSATWATVPDANTLNGPTSITAIGGNTYVTWTERL